MSARQTPCVLVVEDEGAQREVLKYNLEAEGFGSIATEIVPDQTFFYAEDEHQQYLHKNPHGYCPIHATGVKCGPRD